jgi:membrane protein DedA with SNARE-associated domain
VAQAEATGGISGWVVDVIEAIGEPGVGLLMALENILPPIPSEVVLPFAGFSAAQGRIDPFGAWVAATAGALAGAYVLYGLGALVGYDTLYRLAGKRWFVLLGQRDLARGERLFERHGVKIVLFGRCVPLVRSVVSVPAGLVRMPLWRFTALTILGSGVWNALFITLGYRLGAQFVRVEQYVAPIGYAVAAALLVGVVVLAVRRRRRLA